MSEKRLVKICEILQYLFMAFVLILELLIMWDVIGTLPVHAEEAQVYTYTLSGHSVDSSNDTYCDTTIEYYVNGRVALVGDLFLSGVWPDEYFGYNSSILKVSNTGGNSKYGYRIYKYDYTTVKSSDIFHVEFNVNYPSGSGFGNWEWDYSTIVTDIPIFKTVEEAKNYILTGDTTGNINTPVSSDISDESYTYTSFTMNGKTASWTGTTQRSYLLDQDVEEYTTFTYGFASSEDQTVSSFIEYDGEYATADKKLKLPWDEMEAKKKDGEFIRQVNITPCYRVPGAFYRGVGAKVYFHKDGSIDKIVRDFPQSTGDYSYKHIFSSDKYSTDIPAPELSAVSHNGFTLLNNSDNQYYVDIILESSFYGVKMEKDAGTWLPVVDTDWVYNKHYYNFADTSQIAINNDVVYIPNLYSVNPENELITDFKNWSSDYPTYSKLPTMSFLKRGTPARVKYEDQFLYKENSKYTDSEQIRFSHQAESVFYVRYYNKSMVYGPWVRYKFRDAASVEVPGGNLGGAIIDVGQVDVDEDGNVKVDENGNPVVSDNVHGRQDYNTGESNFNDGSFSLSLSDVNSFFDYIQEIFKSITGSLSSFGSLVAACFGFLPSKLINAIIFGIVLMMFIGLIKVIKG